MIQYYVIIVDIQDEDQVPWGAFSETAELGKKGRLCFNGNGINFNSQNLAEQFEKRYTPYLKNKYGNETKTYIRYNEYYGTPVYGVKHLKRIENDSAYAENVLENEKPPKISKKIEIKNGWIILVKKEGVDDLYTMPARSKNNIQMTTDKKEAKIYQRLDAVKKYAEKVNEIKNLEAIIIEINTKNE